MMSHESQFAVSRVQASPSIHACMRLTRRDPRTDSVRTGSTAGKRIQKKAEIEKKRRRRHVPLVSVRGPRTLSSGRALC